MSMEVGPYLGDIGTSDVIDIKVMLTNVSQVPTTLAGTPAVSVYKDNSTTESTAGVTLTVDFDSRTGMINVRVDTSADGTFYSAGSNFQVVITTGTVNSVSVVGYVVGSFSINKRSSLRPSTAGRTIAVASGGQAGLDFNNVNAAGSPTTLTNITVPVVTTLTNAPSDTSGITTLLSRIASAITITGNKVDISDKTGFTLTSAYDPAKTASQAGDSMALTSGGIDAILDRSNGVETGFTLRQAMRLMLSSLAGKLSGAATTTVTIRDVNDTANRIVATVDSNGNRTAVVLTD